MQEHGTILSIDKGLQLWRSGKLSNRTIFSITFDDGLKSSLAAIKKMNALATIPTLFLNGSTCLTETYKLANHPHIPERDSKDYEASYYFTTKDLKALSRNGGLNFEIGSHTQNHRNLRELGDKEIEYEIVNCHRKLERAFNVNIPYFHFLMGKLKARNFIADNISRKLNTTIFECYGGVNNIFREHFNVLRIGVHNETIKEFETLLKRQWIR